MGRRKHEAEPAALDAFGDGLGLALDIDAERREHVGRAGPEEIDRLPCLATGTPAPATTKATQVEILCVPLASPPVPQVSMRLPARAPWWRVAHGAGSAGDFLHRLAADPHAHQQGADLRVGRAARHDQRKCFGGFGLGEGLALRHLAEDRAEIRKHRRACERRARGHRPLLFAPSRVRAARRGRGRGNSASS